MVEVLYRNSKQNLFFLFMVFAYLSAFIYLTAQNFIFSENPMLLGFREIDDVAFQVVLRNMHKSLTWNNCFKVLTNLNHYAYGWLYWFPIIIITYPLYFLSTFYDVHVPLIVVPRQISLIFTFLTALFLYKSLSLYTKDRTIKSTALLLFLMYPTFSYFSQRFGTVGQTMFFSSLAFYLALKTSQINLKSIFFITLAIAASAGTKFSGFLIVPLIGFIIAEKLEWRINLENIKLGFFFVFFLVILSLLFSNPQLLIAIYKPEILKNYTNIILDQLQKTQTSYHLTQPFFSKFSDGIISNTLPTIIFWFLLISLPLCSFLNKKNNYKILTYFFIAIIIISVYLCLTINMGTSYISIYFSTISYILVFGILILESLPRKVQILSCIILFSTSFVWQISQPHYFAYNTYFKRAQVAETKENLRTQKQMVEIIGESSKYKEGLYILRDYQTPPLYNNLYKGVFEKVIYNNIGTSIHQTPLPYHYLLISKKSIAFMPENEFLSLEKGIDFKVLESYRQYRKIIHELLKTNLINDTKYENILETDQVIFFRKVN